MKRAVLLCVACLQISSACRISTTNAADKPYGIARRVPWTTSRIKGSPEPPPKYALERVFPKLKFTNPVVLTDAPGTERLFVCELRGRISSFRNRTDAEPELAVDLGKTVKATRVYGLTFHPDFARNRYCYVCYITGDKLAEGTRVSRFTVKPSEPPTIDPASEKLILTWQSGGHNGGCLKFGTDGYLYISPGDGAGAFPPDSHDTGQNVGDLLASILRIDVDRTADGKPYAIPADNPFVKLAGARGEVWSYGHRNPWKMSFDPATGDLWVGDVGWEMWEMIYRIEKGGNYGWSLVEASQEVHPNRQRGPSEIIPPTVALPHTVSRSVTGGFVYRGKRLPELAGAYIYGDYVTGKIWAAKTGERGRIDNVELTDTPLQIICFGVDHSGELYVVGYDGTLHRLIRNPAVAANLDFPKRLSRTGLFASVKDHRVAPGVIPYSIIAEPWADYTTAERFVALPGVSKLGVNDSSNVQVGYIKGFWSFPKDAVLMKTISIELRRGEPSSRRRLETQVLHFNGQTDSWKAYNYIWNDDQTDAVLADNVGRDRTLEIADPGMPDGVRRQTWHHASRTECLVCHTSRAGTIHGLNPSQLNRPHVYGNVTDNQLRTLEHINLFEQPPFSKAYRKTGMPERMPDPHDDSLPLQERARAYLHVNCGHCHRRGGGGTSWMEIPYTVKLDKANLLDMRPSQGTFGIHAARLAASGDPYRSVLYYRMSKLGRGRMPHAGSVVTDSAGVKLLHDWIASLPEPSTDTDKQIASVKRLRARQRQLLKQLGSAASEGGWTVKINELISSPSGALMLLRLRDDGKLNETLSNTAIKLGSTNADVRIRDLFERFVPEDERIKRLGTSIRPGDILAIEGNADRGRRLFFQTAGVQCRNCHQIKKQGKDVGPELTQIGKKLTRTQLLESLLQPSKKIDPKFATWLVETTAGKVHTGLLASRTDKEIVLKDAAGKIIRIPTGEIEQLVSQRKSLMPELQLRDLTAKQAADLLEFLASLK